MAIFGWICLMVISLWPTFFMVVVSWDGLGTYNIGGVPNPLSTKLLIVVGWILLVGWWYFVVSLAPFTIMVK